MSAPADPNLSSVERQICDANDYPGDGEHVGGNVGIDKLVQIVEQESALVRLDTGAAFEPIFQQSQWTGPRKNFGKDSPDFHKRLIYCKPIINVSQVKYRANYEKASQYGC
jgi:hypothetical protein